MRSLCMCMRATSYTLCVELAYAGCVDHMSVLRTETLVESAFGIQRMLKQYLKFDDCKKLIHASA